MFQCNFSSINANSLDLLILVTLLWYKCKFSGINATSWTFLAHPLYEGKNVLTKMILYRLTHQIAHSGYTPVVYCTTTSYFLTFAQMAYFSSGLAFHSYLLILLKYCLVIKLILSFILISRLQERERDHFSQFITEGFTSYCKRKRRDKVCQNIIQASMWFYKPTPAFAGLLGF